MTEDDDRYVKFNIMGKFILNDNFSNSFSEKQLKVDAQNLFSVENFPNYVKNIEIVPNFNEYFD